MSVCFVVSEAVLAMRGDICALVLVLFCSVSLGAVAPASDTTVHDDLLKSGYEFTASLSPFNHESYRRPGRTVLYPSVKEFTWEDFRQKYVEEGYRPKSMQMPGDHYIDVIPTFLGAVRAGAAPIQWNTSCFSSVSAEFVFTSPDQTSGELRLHVSKDRTCTDIYLLTTRETFEFEDVVLGGDHVVEYKHISDVVREDLTGVGLTVFLVKDDILDTVLCLWDLYQLFLGPDTPDAAKEFFEKVMKIDFEKRPKSLTGVTSDDLPDVGFIGFFELTTYSTLIVYGIGADLDHAGIALRNPEDDKLYVVQMYGSAPTNPGVNISLYDDWVKIKAQNGEMIAYLPLLPEYLNSFNLTAAWDFIYKLQEEKLPFGYQTFVYGFVDTPEGNWPPPLTSEALGVGLVLLEPRMSEPLAVLLGEGLNQRMGNHQCCPVNASYCTGKPCYTLFEVFDWLDKNNMTLGELMSVPEDDSWVYSTGKSYDCDVFVMNIFKEGGLFQDVSFTYGELTPRDAYTVQIYDEQWTRPDACNEDPGISWCQLAGTYRINLRGYNSIKPYDNMFSHCAAQWPDYTYSPPGC